MLSRNQVIALAIALAIISIILLLSRATAQKAVVEPYDFFNDWNNINGVLTMPITSGNPAIDSVQASGYCSKFCGDNIVRDKYRACKINSENKPVLDSPYGLDPCDTLNKIMERQPTFYGIGTGGPGGPEIKEFYDHFYYNDSRYPEQLIPLDFAKDENAYCNKYPIRYPCYLRNSRIDIK